MTKEELFEAIGSLDEALLDENVEHIQKERHFGKIAAIAACALLCIGAVSLPKLLTGQGTVPPDSKQADEVQETAESQETTQFSGFLRGISYYPLPEGSEPDAVCEGGAWLDPVLGRSAYFVLDEMQGLYQFVDPLSSALPETGTYTVDGELLTAVSHDGEQSHTFLMHDAYAMTLNESTSWEVLCGRVFTSRIDAQQPLAEITADSISGIICNGWEISPDAAQLEELVGYLRHVTHYEELQMEEEPRDGGSYVEFTLTENGETSHISISHRFWRDGTRYLLDQQSCDALFAFLEPLAEQARQQWMEDAKALPYQRNVTYRLMDGDSAAETGTEITLGQGNYALCCDGTEETGIYTIENGVLICLSGENEHRFEIVDDYTFRLTATTHTDGGCAAFLGGSFTCRIHPEQPFAALDPETVKRVHYFVNEGDAVLQITPDTRMMEEFLACAAELVIYKQELTSVMKETVDTEQMERINITLEDGSMELLIGDYVLLDGVGYIYEKSSAEKLLEFKERALSGEFSQEETTVDGGYTKPDAACITPIPVTNEVGGITEALIYGRCLGTFKHMEQLSGTTRMCFGKDSPTILEGSFRFDIRNDLYNSEVHSYWNDGTNALAQHDQVWKKGEWQARLLEYTDSTMEDHIRVEENDIVAYDENGNYTLGLGGDPTGVHELGSCFFPYEIASGYLADLSRWKMLGTAEYQGRECVVIEGRGGNYGKRYGVETYTLWVDLETGVWMFFEGCDADGNVNEYVYTKDMRFDADALQPEVLSDTDFEGLSQMFPVYYSD